VAIAPELSGRVAEVLVEQGDRVATGDLVLRLDDLKSEARMESVLSREASFLFNNMMLVGIAATVLLLTTFR
jgi:multidrug resistance efflux pump